MLTHLDLFSGIGCFALGLGRAGFRTVGFCEIDPFCRAVLEKNFPGVWIHDDVRTLTASHVRTHCGGRPTVLSAGVPCQPASVAGRRRGSADERWLWPAFLRVVRETLPEFVLAENVSGFVGLKPHGLDWLIGELEGAGYQCLPVLCGACDVGAPHRRLRVWIVARLVNAVIRGQQGAMRRGERAEPLSERHASAERSAAQESGSGVERLADAECIGQQTRNVFTDASEMESSAGSAEGAERLGGIQREPKTGDDLADADEPRRDRGDRACAVSGRLAEPADGGELADSGNARLAGRSGLRCLHETEQQAVERVCCQWPARPGESQHGWEHPRFINFTEAARAVERSLGIAVDGAAARLVRAAGWSNRQTLKAAGNAVIWQIPYLIGLWMMQQAAPAKGGGESTTAN